jgi:inorganic triphosphatase YgiF
MTEVELKFQVPKARRREVDAAVAGSRPARRVRLQAAYVDTPDRLLASHGMALRMRREGRLWVQTLKGPAADGMTRVEHNVVRGSGAEVPAVDATLHAPVPLGEQLVALLAKRPDAALAVLFRTDIRRRTRLVRGRHGSVELAFDEGFILAGDARLPVCELEIELKNGKAQAVLDSARRWVAQHGLWLDTRTKAERGDLLSRGVAAAAPSLAGSVALRVDMTLAQAWQLVLRSCAEQISVNASQIASGIYGDEHVHQMRVGLRRLRSAWRLFDVADAALPWVDAAAVLFRRLGAARDRDVLEAAFAAPLDEAWRHSATAGGVDDGRGWLPPAPAVGDATEQAVRDPATQALLLALMDLPAPAPADAADESLALLRERIARWHRRATLEALRFDDLDDAARHRLRKRVKRLRYAVDFCASLYAPRDVRRYLRPVKALQARLGALADATMAIDAFREARDRDARAAFALGWLTARREQLIAEAGPDLRAFVKAPRFWKRG